MNCLHLIPYGGIANRVRALVSGLWLADRVGTEVVVSWRPDPFLLGEWSDLYEGELPAPPPGFDTRKTYRVRNLTFLDLDDPAIRDADVVELRTCQAFSFRPDIAALSFRFWGAVRPHLLALTPSAAVESIVAPVAERFGPHVLGAHVRIGGGDMAFNTPNRATVDEFFEEIDAVRSETPEFQLYLASDTASVIDAARARYGSALIAMDDHVDRDFRTTGSVEDIRVGLAEIVLLSRTERLLGTFYSSFAALAGAMGALPYRELCKPDRPAAWRHFRPGPYGPDD